MEKFKKIGIAIWAMGTLTLLAIVLWNFVWKQKENEIYNRGANEREATIMRSITNQFVQSGKLQIPIIVNGSGMPDINGTGSVSAIFILQQ